MQEEQYPVTCKVVSSRAPLRDILGCNDFACSQTFPIRAFHWYVAIQGIAKNTCLRLQYSVPFLVEQYRQAPSRSLLWAFGNPSGVFGKGRHDPFAVVEE